MSITIISLQKNTISKQYKTKTETVRRRRSEYLQSTYGGCTAINVQRIHCEPALMVRRLTTFQFLFHYKSVFIAG